MSLLQGRVFASSASGDNTVIDLRAGRTGELMVSELQGRYYELCYRKLLFSAANQAAQALSTLSTTATGYILGNPPGSGVNLVLLDMCVAEATAPAGIAGMHLAYGGAFSATLITHTAALVVISNLLGASAAVGVGTADNQSTVPRTPVIMRAIGGGPVATGGVSAPFIRDEVAGQIIVAPGTNVSLGYLTTAISVVASMTWAELPQ